MLKNDNWKDKPVVIKKERKKHKKRQNKLIQHTASCYEVVWVSMPGWEISSMSQNENWFCFTLTFKWIPTQIQVFLQCFPSDNLCCLMLFNVLCTALFLYPVQLLAFLIPYHFLVQALITQVPVLFIFNDRFFFCLKQVKELAQGQLVVYSCPTVH